MDKNIINATFIFSWDDKSEVVTECKINTSTREILDINSVDADINEWEWAYVIIDGQKYDVVCMDDVEEVGENEYWFK